MWVVLTYCIIIFLLNFYHNELYHSKVLRKAYLFLYTLVEYTTFTYLLFFNIASRKVRSLILIVSCLFTVFLVFFNFVITYRRFDSIPTGAETLLLLVFSIYFFYEQFKNSSTFYIYHHYCFWFTIGILIYLSGSFFIYVFADQLNSAELNEFWTFTYIVEIIKNIFFTIGLLIYARKPFAKPPKMDLPYLDFKES